MSRKLHRVLWIGGWIAVAAALASVAAGLRDSARAERGSLAERLLGPVASLASSVQWVRVDAAIRRGDYGKAYARAESALRLCPQDPEGWIFLAHHLLFDRASVQREPDPAARALWIRAGLETLDRGERASRDPGAILFERGVALAFLGSLADADRAWPSSSEEAWHAAAEAFESSAAHGFREGARAAGFARERAHSLERAR